MQIRIGTSGWNYTEWRGSFYPKDMKPAAMLAYYSARFSTVEVNNTFYRMPDRQGGRGLGGHRARPASPSCSRRRSGSPTSPGCATSTSPSASSATPRGWWAASSAPCSFSCRPTSRWTSGDWRTCWRFCHPTCARPSSFATPRGSPTRSTRAWPPATPRSASPTTTTAPRRRWRHPTGAISGCGPPAMPTTICAAGSPPCIASASAGATRSSSSSTRTPAPAPRWAHGWRAHRGVTAGLRRRSPLSTGRAWP